MGGGRDSGRRGLHRVFGASWRVWRVAARAKEFYEKAAKERQKLSEGRGVKKGMDTCPDLNQGTARDQAGKEFGVSGRGRCVKIGKGAAIPIRNQVCPPGFSGDSGGRRKNVTGAVAIWCGGVIIPAVVESLNHQGRRKPKPESYQR